MPAQAQELRELLAAVVALVRPVVHFVAPQVRQLDKISTTFPTRITVPSYVEFLVKFINVER